MVRFACLLAAGMLLFRAGGTEGVLPPRGAGLSEASPGGGAVVSPGVDPGGVRGVRSDVGPGVSPGGVPGVGPGSREERFLADALAQRCGDVSFAARVGIAAVALRRMASPDFPDTAAQVLAGLEKEQAFGGGKPRGGTGRLFERAAEGILSLIAPDRETREETGRLTRDAVRAAANGADPTEGALYFRIAEPPGGWDLDFDDGREDAEAERIARELADYPKIIGRVGFR